MQLTNLQLKLLWCDLHNVCRDMDEDIQGLSSTSAQRDKKIELVEWCRQRRMAQTVILTAYLAQGGVEDDLWN